MSALALFGGISMDGIPDLIDRWMEAELGRTQKELAEIVGVSPRTVGRWRRMETTPEGDELERLGEALELDTQTMQSAARETNRRRKASLPRDGLSPARQVPAKYVFTPADKQRWREMVAEDEVLSLDARKVLQTFTYYYPTPHSLDAAVDQERIAEDWKELTIDVVASVWAEVADSPYVFRVPTPGWVFRLQFPDDD